MRYDRQIALPGIGLEGQAKLSRARVLIIGAGGLGSPAALYLAGAGVGHLGLVDADRIELSNLHRQILYRTEDEGSSKVECAATRLRSLNPEIQVQTYPVMVNAENVESLITGYDLVIDGTDDLPTRGVVHDACYRAGKTYILGAVFRFEGHVGVFSREQESCLRCLFPDSEKATPANCNEAGTLGSVTGVIGSLQATEALKVLLGIGEPLYSSLLIYDALSARNRVWKFQRRADCFCCGTGKREPMISFEAFLSEHPLSLVVDLRESHELASGVLPGAKSIPLARLEEAALSWERTTPVLLYCQRGGRSKGGVEILRSFGFSQVHELTGGIEAFRRGSAQVVQCP